MALYAGQRYFSRAAAGWEEILRFLNRILAAFFSFPAKEQEKN